jgi:hypothetical protein
MGATVGLSLGPYGGSRGGGGQLLLSDHDTRQGAEHAPHNLIGK